VSRRRDITHAELNTGTVRQRFNRRYRKHPKPQTLPKRGDYCLDCGKDGYKTEEAAREALGRMARAGKLVEAGSFAVRPYICPHGWWHFGRNRQVIERFRKHAKQQTSPV